MSDQEKRRGRPRVEQPKRTVSVRLDDKVYDLYCIESYRSTEHVSTLMRTVLTRHAPRRRREFT